MHGTPWDTKESNMPGLRFPKEDEAYSTIRTGDLPGFAGATAGRHEIDFSGADLRGVDLRKVDISKIVLRGAYLRDADLRGLDLRSHDLEGCSLLHAKISGAYLPADISAEEIRLSVEHGIRIRRGC